MGDLATAETKGHLDLVAFLEEAVDGFHFDAVVMLVDTRAQFDFLDLDHFLLFARLGGLFLLGKAETTVIEDLADGGHGVGRDLHEIEAGLFGQGQSILQLDGAVILTFGIDQTALHEREFHG